MQQITPELITQALQSRQPEPHTDSKSDQEAAYKRLFIDCARSVCPSFRVAPEQKEAISDIFRWCMMLPGRLDPDRGLLITGSIGSGKSTMLQIIRAFCRKVRPLQSNGLPYAFRTTPALCVAADFNSGGYDAIATYTDSPHQAFDDLGCEPRRLNYYGTAVNVMEHVILSRYGRWDDFTHLTTNLSLDDIQREYGDRVFDRCREMFNIVTLKGRSYRAPQQ